MAENCRQCVFTCNTLDTLCRVTSTPVQLRQVDASQGCNTSATSHKNCCLEQLDSMQHTGGLSDLLDLQ